MKKNVSILKWTKELNFPAGEDRKHLVQMTPGTFGGNNLVGDEPYVPTKLDIELDRLREAGAKVVGFKRVGDSFAIKTMVPL